MRRAQAILVFLSLLATPLALIARGEACAAACAKSCCLIASHARNAADSHHACHGQAPVPRGMCCSGVSSSHALDYGFTTPLPQTVLTSSQGVERPQIERRIISRDILTATSIASPPPFEPPRA